MPMTHEQHEALDMVVLLHVRAKRKICLNQLARLHLNEVNEHAICQEPGAHSYGWRHRKRKAALSRSLKRLQRRGLIDLVGRQGSWYWVPRKVN